MNKKWLIVSLLALSTFLIGLSVYFYSKIKSIEESKLDLTKTPLDETLLIADQSNPIKKTVLQDDQGFRYELEGTLVESLVVFESGALKGTMKVRGDPLNREIVFYLAGGEDKVFFGEYEKSFASDGSWRLLPTAEVAAKVKEGEAIKIATEFQLSQKAGGGVDGGEVLDTLLQEFSGKREPSLSLPNDFFLSALRLGVIR